MGKEFLSRLLDQTADIKLIDFDRPADNDFAIVDELTFGPEAKGVVPPGYYRSCQWYSPWIPRSKEAQQRGKYSERIPPYDTPKPVGLVERMLEIASNKDSIILDSFAGSGTDNIHG